MTILRDMSVIHLEHVRERAEYCWHVMGVMKKESFRDRGGRVQKEEPFRGRSTEGGTLHGERTEDYFSGRGEKEEPFRGRVQKEEPFRGRSTEGGTRGRVQRRSTEGALEAGRETEVIICHLD